MRTVLTQFRNRLDSAGIILSSLCAVHCVLSVVLVGVLGLGGEVLLSPSIHRFGLAIALVVGLISLGFGVRRHGRVAPLVIGGAGLGLMAVGLIVPHGIGEAAVTIAGVSLVAFAHMRNLRSHACT